MSFYQRGIRIVSARIIFREFYLFVLSVVYTDRFRYQIFVSAMHALNRHAQTDDNKGLPASIQQLDSRTFSITGSVTGYTTTTTNDVNCQQANR